MLSNFARPSRRICNAARTAAAARPTLDDVERIAGGKPARRRGVGSRAVPHRLNADEVRAFQRAKQQGFVQLHGAGNRRERAGSPLSNTFRNWCDANAVPSVAVYKQLGEGDDTVSADLSTLRQTKVETEQVAARCMQVASGGVVHAEEWEQQLQHEEEDRWTQPIHQLLPYRITWSAARADAKKLADNLVQHFEVPTAKYR